MKYKKGVIEIQFNWIFVLIIGAVILIVFTGIILRQKNISETSKNVLILNNLDAVISGAEASTGTTNIIRVPKTKIEFRCNRYAVGQLSKQLDIMNVFTPRTIIGDRLLSTTLDFSVPYRVTNLVYLTSPEYRYVFVENNRMHTLMPNGTFYDIYSDINDIMFREEGRVRFVLGDSTTNQQIKDFDLSDYASLQDEDVTALKISGNMDSGSLEFFEKRNGKFTFTGASSYITKETILGAIFTDDPELYSCVMANVFEKTNIVTQIHGKKMQSLKQRYSGSRCGSLANDPYDTSYIDQLQAASLFFSPENSNLILDAADHLKDQNRQAQLESCATIY
jgi:hypothetical protein